MAATDRLGAWLIASTTGAHRIRAGVPPGWTVGDKTGTGGNGTTNDEAVLWPPGRSAIIICVFFTGSGQSDAKRDEIVVRIGRIAVDAR